MDIDIRDFAADHYAEANTRPPRPEIEAHIKAYDARNAVRPVMIAVDTIATLPLDAAAMQRGYVG